MSISQKIFRCTRSFSLALLTVSLASSTAFAKGRGASDQQPASQTSTTSTQKYTPITVDPAKIKFTYNGPKNLRVHASGPSVSQKSPVIVWFHNTENGPVNQKTFSSGSGSFLVTDEKGVPIEDKTQSRNLKEGEKRQGYYIYKDGDIITLRITSSVERTSPQWPKPYLADDGSTVLTVGAHVKEIIISDDFLSNKSNEGLDANQFLANGKMNTIKDNFKMIY